MLYDLHLDLFDSTHPEVVPVTQLSVSMRADAGPNSEVLVAARLLVVGAMASNELWVGDMYDAARCRVVADGVAVGAVSMDLYTGTRVDDDDHTWTAEDERWELEMLPFLGEAPF